MGDETTLEKNKRCILFDLLVYLENIKLKYISLTLVFLIILISIFGRIKFQYRWFILNLAIIDLFQIYNSICTNISTNCYFTNFLTTTITADHFFLKLACIGLFILTGSRFLGLFYSQKYKKLQKSWHTILAIIIIDLAFLAIYYLEFFTLSQLGFLIFEKCSFYVTQKEITFGNISCNANSISDISTDCFFLRNESYYSCHLKFNSDWSWTLWIDKIQQATPVIALLFSVIFVAFMVAKIIKQVKFQKSSNKEVLKCNIRIISVLMTQTFLLAFILVLDIIFELGRSYIPGLRLKYFPCWAYWITDQKSTIKFLSEIRIFIDSILVVGFMSGYREDLIGFFKWIYQKSFGTVTKKILHSRIFVTLT